VHEISIVKARALLAICAALSSAPVGERPFRKPGSAQGLLENHLSAANLPGFQTTRVAIHVSNKALTAEPWGSIFQLPAVWGAGSSNMV
jgi:hypothetical protein